MKIQIQDHQRVELIDGITLVLEKNKVVAAYADDDGQAIELRLDRGELVRFNGVDKSVSFCSENFLVTPNGFLRGDGMLFTQERVGDFVKLLSEKDELGGYYFYHVDTKALVVGTKVDN